MWDTGDTPATYKRREASTQPNTAAASIIPGPESSPNSFSTTSVMPHCSWQGSRTTPTAS